MGKNQGARMSCRQLLLGFGVLCVGAAAIWLYPFTREKHSTFVHEKLPSFTGFQNDEGLWIYTKEWIPSGPLRGVLVLAHGFGEHSGRYVELAAAYNSEGIAVHALDHQGMGRSEGDRGHVVHFGHFARDFNRFVDIVRTQYSSRPNIPLFVLGHSLGSVVALEALLRNPRPYLAGALFTGTALHTDPSIATPFILAISSYASWALPKASLAQLDRGKISRDPAVVAEASEDPLCQIGGIRARLAYTALLTADWIRAELSKLTVPIFVAHGTADGITMVDGSRDIVRLAGSTDKVLKEYPGLYHEIFREPEKLEVIRDMVSFVTQRIPKQ